jgi:hypothetical protein
MLMPPKIELGHAHAIGEKLSEVGEVSEVSMGLKPYLLDRRFRARGKLVHTCFSQTSIVRRIESARVF